jgi:colanic acid biosynthesis glycosyl transferase WcaI
MPPDSLKILLLNQFYAPDTAATGQLLADVADGLVADGHEVHVLASLRLYGGGATTFPAESVTASGVMVHRVAATGFGRAGFIGRLLDYGSFYVRAMRRAMQLPRMDVCIALTTPPFIGLVATQLRKRRSTKFVHWAMDLYPEMLVAVGMIRNGGLPQRLLATLAARIYRQSDAIIALGDIMRERLIAAGAAPDKVTVVHNWVPGEAVQAQPPAGGPVTLLYSGNVGLGHELETAVRAIARLEDRRNFRARIVGHGKLRSRLMGIVSDLGLGDCVEFLPPCPLEELSASLAAGDIHLVSQRPGTQGLLVPSKIYGILSAARPSLYIGPADTEVAEIIRQSDSGLIVPPGDVVAAATSLRRLIADEPLRRQMGERAGGYYRHRFGRSTGVRHVADIVHAVAARP